MHNYTDREQLLIDELAEQGVGLRRRTRRIRYSGEEWYRMRTWIARHLDIIRSAGETPGTIAIRMRASGISCNEHAATQALLGAGIELQREEVAA